VRITIDPATRLSGNFRVTVELEDGSVTSASSSGMAYRGFEQMLLEKDPMDAPYFTQRICGMCSSSHATAAVNAIESACGATHLIPKDALLVRNALNGLNWVKNHITHLYMGFLPDLADPVYGDALNSSDLGNLLWDELKKRYAVYDGRAYVEALRCVKLIGRAEGILGGRSPASPVIVPGGVTTTPSRGDLSALAECAEGIDAFLRGRLLGALTVDEWLAGTHDDGMDGFALKYAQELPADDLSVWGDLPLYMMFCSRMVAKDTLELPAYIGLDGIGGYSPDDQLIGFLSFGSFYRVRDESGGFKDGYSQVEDERADSFELPAGFTPGSLLNLNYAADRPDPNLIVEHACASYYSYTGSKASETPVNGETIPLQKAGDINYDGIRYSFIKAPRYGRVPCEVGPLARLINAREKLAMDTMRMLSSASYPKASVYTRVLARMQETLLVSRMLRRWAGDLEPGGGRRYSVSVAMRQNRSGSGLIEAPRGALGHWLRVGGGGRISNYQVVAPTTWNASPKCSERKYGPIELALLGGQTTPSGYLPGSEANPVGLYHTIRSFDPCVACAVHLVRR